MEGKGERREEGKEGKRREGGREDALNYHPELSSRVSCHSQIHLYPEVVQVTISPAN